MSKHKLHELFNLQMGKTPTRDITEYWNDGSNKWVSIADLSTYSKYVGDTKETITDFGVKKSGIKIVPENTVLLSFKLSLGKVAITTNPIYTNEAIMAFIDKHIREISKDYLYYLFSALDWSKGTNKAVKGTTLNKATLSAYEIELPDFTLQCYRAIRLDKVVNLISLRQKQLEQLDTLIKSQFTELFGDPVRNEKGWQTTPLHSLCSRILGGGTPSKSRPEYYIGKIPWVTPKDMKSTYIEDSIDHISDNAVECSTTNLIPANSILMVVRSGILKHTLPLAINTIPVTINQDMKAFLVNGSVNNLFAFHLLKQWEQDLLTNVRAVTADNIEFSIIKNLSAIVPPLPLQTRFAEFVQEVDKSKFTIRKSLEKLETCYKALMQEYFG
jgi:type I restriction enzyme S subunit